jgi:hypothetical protein
MQAKKMVNKTPLKHWTYIGQLVVIVVSLQSNVEVSIDECELPTLSSDHCKVVFDNLNFQILEAL